MMKNDATVSLNDTGHVGLMVKQVSLASHSSSGPELQDLLRQITPLTADWFRQ